jgi:hypothetical protein
MEARHATPPYVLRRFVAEERCDVGAALGDADKLGAVTSIARDDASATWHGLCVLHRRDADAAEVRAVDAPHVVARLR